MSTIIDVLMQEHRLIERVLGSLETCAIEARRGTPVPRVDAADFVAFFRGYADALHHGKEDDMLFARMRDYGFPGDSGPLGVMAQEHAYGRAQVGAIAALTAGEGDLSQAEAAAFARYAFAFVNMLREHIAKEDRILYPMAIRSMADEDIAAMTAAFPARDLSKMALDRRVVLERVAVSLQERWPPDEGRMALAGDPGEEGGGCC